MTHNLQPVPQGGGSAPFLDTSSFPAQLIIDIASYSGETKNFLEQLSKNKGKESGLYPKAVEEVLYMLQNCFYIYNDAKNSVVTNLAESQKRADLIAALKIVRNACKTLRDTLTKDAEGKPASGEYINNLMGNTVLRRKIEISLVDLYRYNPIVRNCAAACEIVVKSYDRMIYAKVIAPGTYMCGFWDVLKAANELSWPFAVSVPALFKCFWHYGQPALVSEMRKLLEIILDPCCTGFVSMHKANRFFRLFGYQTVQITLERYAFMISEISFHGYLTCASADSVLFGCPDNTFLFHFFCGLIDELCLTYVVNSGNGSCTHTRISVDDSGRVVGKQQSAMHFIKSTTVDTIWTPFRGKEIEHAAFCGSMDKFEAKRLFAETAINNTALLRTSSTRGYYTVSFVCKGNMANTRLKKIGTAPETKLEAAGEIYSDISEFLSRSALLQTKVLEIPNVYRRPDLYDAKRKFHKFYGVTQ
eukprot:TRINITY_DN637_c0_g1_i1.p1 TRINITY_DN637_c0_g1~~TRINITY_DN637_c0_g1_i1.p1  ORF type:complete len:500 (+),score=37.55 TRINITY_DN637_c0_g1_i1:81-1502(+)